MPNSSRPPFDDVRAAFDRLATPDKVAFVLEATFETIGQALGETGRRVSDVVSSFDVDSLFRDAPSAERPSAAPGAAPARPKRSPRPPRPDAPGGPAAGSGPQVD